MPDCFWFEISKRQLYFPGNIEMHYCRPGRFVMREPWSLLGFEPGTRYAIVRFVKWDAYHDVALIGGYTPEDKIRLVRSLEAAGLRVLITSEAELPAELEHFRARVPIERMHDVMACAELFIGESSSMASECVVLGTPAIYVDQVGRGYTDEEAREGLLYMFRPVPTAADVPAGDKPFILGGRRESIDKALEIAGGGFGSVDGSGSEAGAGSVAGVSGSVDGSGSAVGVSDSVDGSGSSVGISDSGAAGFDRAAWKARHERWMATKFDCTDWLTWFIENYPASEREWRDNRPELEKRFR